MSSSVLRAGRSAWVVATCGGKDVYAAPCVPLAQTVHAPCTLYCTLSRSNVNKLTRLFIDKGALRPDDVDRLEVYQLYCLFEYLQQ